MICQSLNLFWTTIALKTHISSEILLLAQDLLVSVKLAVKTFDKVRDNGFIGHPSAVGLEDLLGDSFGGEDVKVTGLNRGCLIIQGTGFELGRDQPLSSLICVFRGDVGSDSATLEDDKAVIVLGSQSA